jgi:hypothetical protein
LRLADRVAGVTRPRTGWWSELARLNLAEVYLAAGRPESCLAEVSGDDGGDEVGRGAELRRGGPSGGDPDVHRSALGAVALLAAVSLFVEAEAPVEEGIARHLLATLHAAAGRHDEATAELGRAPACPP